MAGSGNVGCINAMLPFYTLIRSSVSILVSTYVVTHVHTHFLPFHISMHMCTPMLCLHPCSYTCPCKRLSTCAPQPPVSSLLLLKKKARVDGPQLRSNMPQSNNRRCQRAGASLVLKGSRLGNASATGRIVTCIADGTAFFSAINTGFFPLSLSYYCKAAAGCCRCGQRQPGKEPRGLQCE